MADEPGPAPGEVPLQAEAGVDVDAQAEAALWAAVPAVLRRAEAVGARDDSASTRTKQTVVAEPLPAYQPTRSERRQARRLLHTYSVETVLGALRSVVHSYRPAPGQPETITRFGFAAGLPAFRAALADPEPRTLEEVAAVVTGETRVTAVSSTADGLQEDFWHEYERVNERASTRAERRRIEALAGRVEWRKLLIWLDRWERAHQGVDAEVGPGYFETCAEDEMKAPPAHTPQNVKRDHARGARLALEERSDGAAGLSEEQQRAYAYMAGLGIRAARLLAQLPTTTTELVEAWWRTAQERTDVKDKRAYVASGVGTGQPPKEQSNGRLRSAVPSELLPPIEAGATSADDGNARVWATVLDLLATELPSSEFDTWIRPCMLLELDERAAVIGAPNVFVRQALEHSYRELIEAAVEEVAGYHAAPLFVIH